MSHDKKNVGVRTNTISLGRGALAAVILAAGLAAMPAYAQEVTLRATSIWPKNFFLTESFIRFTEKLNAAGKGVVQIQFAGGPEVIPGAEAPAAVRRGAIDMYFGSMSYTLGSVPEADAVAGGTKSPAELRANGGFALLDDITQKKMNAKLLSMPDSGWSFVLYLRNEPKITDGKVDLTGVKVRSLPLYNDFMTALGATNVVVPTTELYTAFERGMVDGAPFPEIGIRDFKIEKFVKVRLFPGYYQGDIVTLVNADRWKALPEKAKEILTQVAIAYEAESRERIMKDRAAEDAKLEELGVKKVTLTGKTAEDYLAKANAVPWSRMQKGDPTNLEALKAKFR